MSDRAWARQYWGTKRKTKSKVSNKLCRSGKTNKTYKHALNLASFAKLEFAHASTVCKPIRNIFFGCTGGNDTKSPIGVVKEGAKILTVSAQQNLVWDIASRSTKQYFKILRRNGAFCSPWLRLWLQLSVLGIFAKSTAPARSSNLRVKKMTYSSHVRRKGAGWAKDTPGFWKFQQKRLFS